MKHTEKLFHKAAGLIGVVAGLLFGAPDGLLYALLAMMALDYLSGLLCGAVQQRLSSSISFCGLCRKLTILMLVAVGHILDAYVLSGGGAVRTAVEGFYIANEGISILENIGTLGLPLPRRLRQILVQIQNKEEEDKQDE